MTTAAIQGFAVQASPEIVQHWGWFRCSVSDCLRLASPR
jgi:hypothetical protein